MKCSTVALARVEQQAGRLLRQVNDLEYRSGSRRHRGAAAVGNLIGALGVVVLLACSSHPGSPSALAAPASAAIAPSPQPLAAGAWGTVHSVRFGLDLPLPERTEWTVNDKQEPWLVAQHAASRSEILLRAWRAPRASTPEACLRQARLWRPDLPRWTSAPLLERRKLVAPAEYRGEVGVGAQILSADEAAGFVVAAGARTGRCLVFWYRTRVGGPSAENVVAENLAVVSAGVVDRIRETEIADAVQRELPAPTD